MSHIVGEQLTATLAEVGVTEVFGIVADALNPFTDTIRRDKNISWIGVRHEEGAGATHLLAGLYEARHDHAPVLAISGDVPKRLLPSALRSAWRTAFKPWIVPDRLVTF